MVVICYQFLGAIITQGVMAQAMASGKPFYDFARVSDMVYAGVVIENYWDTWDAMTAYTKEKPGKKWPNHDSKELESVAYAYGSLSRPAAQARYHEIRDRVQGLMDSTDKKKNYSDKFMAYHSSHRKMATSKKCPFDCACGELSEQVYETGFLSSK